MPVGGTGRQTGDPAGVGPAPRVLVVEDEPGIAGFVRRGLLFEGFAVDVASDGRAALAAIRDRPPESGLTGKGAKAQAAPRLSPSARPG